MKGSTVQRGGVPRVLRAAFLAVLLGAVGVFHVWSRTQVIASGYRLARLEAEHRRLLAEGDRLRIEVTTLRAPGRLESFARTRLGMAPPAPGAVVAGAAGGVAMVGGGKGGAGHRTAPAEPASRAPGVRVAWRGPAGERRSTGGF